MKINKLVRDNIPDIIAREDGKRVTFRVLNDEEYIEALHKKLDEEVAEYHESKDPEELADILEVIDALAKATGNGGIVLDEVFRKKRKSRGRFDKRYFLEEVIDGKE